MFLCNYDTQVDKFKFRLNSREYIFMILNISHQDIQRCLSIRFYFIFFTISSSFYAKSTVRCGSVVMGCVVLYSVFCVWYSFTVVHIRKCLYDKAAEQCFNGAIIFVVFVSQKEQKKSKKKIKPSMKLCLSI